MKEYLKSIILFAFLSLFIVSCSGQPAPAESAMEPGSEESSSLSKDIVVDDQVNNASENQQMSDTSNTDVSSEGSQEMKVIYFEFDQFDLTGENVGAVSSNAEVLLSSSTSIKLEGNCDEWGSDEYNYALGLKRAKTVKDTLVSSGIDAERISMVSYGESNPICSEKNKSCWSQNRRVETKFLP